MPYSTLRILFIVGARDNNIGDFKSMLVFQAVVRKSKQWYIDSWWSRASHIRAIDKLDRISYELDVPLDVYMCIAIPKYFLNSIT